MLIAFKRTESSVLKDWLMDSIYWKYENADDYDEELLDILI